MQISTLIPIIIAVWPGIQVANHFRSLRSPTRSCSSGVGCPVKPSSGHLPLMESDSGKGKRGGLRQRVAPSSASVLPDGEAGLRIVKDQHVAVSGEASDCSLSDVRGLQSSLEDQASTLPRTTSRGSQEAAVSSNSAARGPAPAKQQQPGNVTERASRKLFPSVSATAIEDHLRAAHDEARLAFARRWNFDVSTMQPSAGPETNEEGRWQWMTSVDREEGFTASTQAMFSPSRNDRTFY